MDPQRNRINGQAGSAPKSKEKSNPLNKQLGELLVKYAVLDSEAKAKAKHAAAIAEQIEQTMQDNGMKSVEASGRLTPESPLFAASAGYKEKEVASVNVVKLHKLCKDEKTFLKVVSATQKDVTAHLGDLVLQQCLERTSVGEKFFLKYKKD